VQALIDLVVTLTGPAAVAVGSQASFTLVVANFGPNDATNVAVIYALPSNTVFVATASSPGLTLSQAAGGSVGIVLPAIAANGSATFTITISPTVAAQGPTLTSVAAAAADQTTFNQATTFDSVTSTLLFAPVVVGLARFGAAPSAAFLTVTFDQNMNLASVQNTANYRIVLPGRDGRFNTRDDVRVPITSATYNPSTKTVVLALGRRFGVYTKAQLTVLGQSGGVADEQGVLLAGNGSGLPGYNYVTTFGHAIYRGSASRLAARTPARVRARA
jgi:uncharacterized repeat protein (TIGR01451 family)